MLPSYNALSIRRMRSRSIFYGQNCTYFLICASDPKQTVPLLARQSSSPTKETMERIGYLWHDKKSRTGPRYNPTMLLVSIFFWEGSTNTFQFPCGMLTPTLFDMTAITRLTPLGENFTPTLETTNEFTIKLFSFKNFH